MVTRRERRRRSPQRRSTDGYRVQHGIVARPVDGEDRDLVGPVDQEVLGKIATLLLILVAIPLVAYFFASTITYDLAKARNIRTAGWVIAAILAAVATFPSGRAPFWRICTRSARSCTSSGRSGRGPSSTAGRDRGRDGISKRTLRRGYDSQDASAIRMLEETPGSGGPAGGWTARTAGRTTTYGFPVAES